MRSLSLSAQELDGFDPIERQALELVAAGRHPHDVAEQLHIGEPEVFRLVTAVLDEKDPPVGSTMESVHAELGSRPATAAELREFDEMYGVAPSDEEG